MRAGGLRSDAGLLGSGPAPVEGELDRRPGKAELDVLAAEALSHGKAAVDVEPLARLDVRDPQQQHEVVDFSGGGAGLLLRGGRDLPDGAVRGLDDAAVPPEAL